MRAQFFSTPAHHLGEGEIQAMLRGSELAPPASAQRPALFVDLERSLVEHLPDSAEPAQLRFQPGAGDALAQLQGAGLALVVVTNQSRLASGRFARAEFAKLQHMLEWRLLDEFGVALDDVAVCPHAPDAHGRPACLCRMPAPGLLLRMAQSHGLDLAQSFIVGDTLDAVEAGHRAGATGLLLDTGAETVWRRSPLRAPAATATAWAGLAAHVLARQPSTATPAAAAHAG